MTDAPPRSARPGSAIAGFALAGGLFGASAAVGVGFALDQLGRAGGREAWSGAARAAAVGLRAFLLGGGWLTVPLWGAAIGALCALPRAATGRERGLALGASAGLVALSFLLHPALPQVLPGSPSGPAPRGLDAKVSAIRRWSFRSPEGVRQVLALSHDPDTRVRELAVLALGVNRVVSELEHPTTEAPPRPELLRLRDDLRARLEECLGDSLWAVRAEAARALWKSPRAFGTHPAAAETLAAILGRALHSEVPERLVWLALDAAAGPPHPALRVAATAFAESSSDSALRRAAVRALRSEPGRPELFQAGPVPGTGP